MSISSSSNYHIWVSGREMEKKRRAEGGPANEILYCFPKSLLKSFCLNLKTYLKGTAGICSWIHRCCQWPGDCVNKQEVGIDVVQAADISATQRIWSGIHIMDDVYMDAWSRTSIKYFIFCITNIFYDVSTEFLTWDTLNTELEGFFIIVPGKEVENCNIPLKSERSSWLFFPFTHLSEMAGELRCFRPT